MSVYDVLGAMDKRTATMFFLILFACCLFLVGIYEIGSRLSNPRKRK